MPKTDKIRSGKTGGDSKGSGFLSEVLENHKTLQSENKQVAHASKNKAVKPADDRPASGIRNISKKKATVTDVNAKDAGTLPGQAAYVPCFYTADTAYYTFYYFHGRDTILYSDPFPVETYTDKEDGKRLLTEAWGCLSSKLTEQLGERRFHRLMNDVDYDLAMGFQHLRDVGVLSASVVTDYPYTASPVTASAELKKWLAYDVTRNPDIHIVKVNFP